MYNYDQHYWLLVMVICNVAVVTITLTCKPYIIISLLLNVQEKKAQLADKLHRKNKEGKKRQEDLKTRRQQEMIEKIKKREERVRRVAEKQAALRQKEEEKKQKIKVQCGEGSWLLQSLVTYWLGIVNCTVSWLLSQVYM